MFRIDSTILSGKASKTIGPVAVVILLLILAVVASSGCLKSFPGQLRITEMDVAAENVRGSSLDVNITTYVENYRGGSSENSSILLKAVDTKTGLLVAQDKSDIEAVKGSSTVGVSQTLRLSKKGDYRLVAVLFEGDTVQDSGTLTISNLESLPPDIEDTGIEIEGLDFIARKTTGGDVDLQCDIYFTNQEADPDAKFDLMVQAKEIDAGLVADKRWTGIGGIRQGTTVMKSVNLTVPDQYNYVVEVLVWSNDTIVLRGDGQVLLKPYVKSGDEGAAAKTIETSRFVRERSSPASEVPAESSEDGFEMAPGFGIALGLVALGAAGITRRRRYGR